MRTRTIALVSLLAGALFLTACGDADDPTVAGSDDAASASQAQFNDADVAFVAGMVPHHTQAVEMADMILDKMQQLEQASGVEIERMFLTMMIEHHRGAIQAADTELADGEYPPALDLANTIRDDQTAEIAAMEQLLSQL